MTCSHLSILAIKSQHTAPGDHGCCKVGAKGWVGKILNSPYAVPARQRPCSRPCQGTLHQPCLAPLSTIPLPIRHPRTVPDSSCDADCSRKALGLPPHGAGRYEDLPHLRQNFRCLSERHLPTQPHDQAGHPFTPVSIPYVQLLIQGGKSPLDSGRSSDTAVSAATSRRVSPLLSFAAPYSPSAVHTWGT